MDFQVFSIAEKNRKKSGRLLTRLPDFYILSIVANSAEAQTQAGVAQW
jgi:hypothetical protein